jgi:hypothetical protein
MGEFVEEMFSYRRFNDAIEASRLELPLHFTNGFDTFGTDFTTSDRPQSYAGFIHTEKPHPVA